MLTCFQRSVQKFLGKMRREFFLVHMFLTAFFTFGLFDCNVGDTTKLRLCVKRN